MLYKEITEARKILGIPEKASIKFIRKKYNEELKKWHPDKCNENKQICEEKTKEIIKAGKILLEFCNNYLIDFSEKEVNQYISGDELWKRKFGEDPLWSSIKNN